MADQYPNADRDSAQLRHKRENNNNNYQAAASTRSAERPLSVYDNLSSDIPNISFRFDDDDEDCNDIMDAAHRNHHHRSFGHMHRISRSPPIVTDIDDSGIVDPPPSYAKNAADANHHAYYADPARPSAALRNRSPDAGDDAPYQRSRAAAPADEASPASTAATVRPTMTSTPSIAASASSATPTAGNAAQYENVVETIKLRNSFRQLQQQAQPIIKPAISDAKSTFFGLNNASNPQPSASSSVADPSVHHRTLAAPVVQPLYAMPHASRHQTPSGGPASGDRSPLLDDAPAPTSVKSNGEYQNIPSNSALFQQQRPCDGLSAPPNGTEDAFATTDNDADAYESTNQRQRISEQYLQQYSSSNIPSQAVYMTTTVPQNIKGSNIAGRHTPTRTSLRHSRMIVVNKNYQAPRRPNPLNLSYPLLAKLLLVVQLLCGIMIGCLSVWVLLWAPSTRVRDNPYWSGSLLFVSAVLALVLIEFRRVPRQRAREHCYTFLRLNSTALSMLAMCVAFVAFVFASLHLDNVVTSSATHCQSADVFSSSNAVCVCRFGASDAEAIGGDETPSNATTAATTGWTFEYRDLSCTEVRGPWKYILFTFTLLNMIAFIVSFLYLMMLCCPRRGHKIRAPSTAGGNSSAATAATSAYSPVRSAL